MRPEPTPPAPSQNQGQTPQVKVKPNILQPSNPVVTYAGGAPKQPTPPSTPAPTPAPTTQKPAPAEIKPALENGDIIGDKLTKIVRIPSERKQYVVDPYREPLDN
jgi:hypothetical protein